MKEQFRDIEGILRNSIIVLNEVQKKKKRGKREYGGSNIWKKSREFSQLKKNISLQFECACLVLRKINENKSTQKHKIIKLKNIKIYILKNYERKTIAPPKKLQLDFCTLNKVFKKFQIALVNKKIKSKKRKKTKTKR